MSKKYTTAEAHAVERWIDLTNKLSGGHPEPGGRLNLPEETRRTNKIVAAILMVYMAIYETEPDS